MNPLWLSCRVKTGSDWVGGCLPRVWIKVGRACAERGCVDFYHRRINNSSQAFELETF